MSSSPQYYGLKNSVPTVLWSTLSRSSCVTFWGILKAGCAITSPGNLKAGCAGISRVIWKQDALVLLKQRWIFIHMSEIVYGIHEKHLQNKKHCRYRLYINSPSWHDVFLNFTKDLVVSFIFSSLSLSDSVSNIWCAPETTRYRTILWKPVKSLWHFAVRICARRVIKALDVSVVRA